MGADQYAKSYNSSVGSPFWGDKGGWLTTETTFNADRFAAPTLFTYHGNGSPPWAPKGGQDSRDPYSVIGALNANRKPFEYLVFAEGAHALQRPRERQGLMQSAVDWLNFWLKGVSPSDPVLAARWKSLRHLQDESLAAAKTKL